MQISPVVVTNRSDMEGMKKRRRTLPQLETYMLG